MFRLKIVCNVLILFYHLFPDYFIKVSMTMNKKMSFLESSDFIFCDLNA